VKIKAIASAVKGVIILIGELLVKVEMSFLNEN
jgi:hypothetical protein